MSLTYAEITSVLGPVDEMLLAEIVASEATIGEIREAWAWLHGDEALMNQGRPMPGTRVASLMELLEPLDDEV